MSRTPLRCRIRGCPVVGFWDPRDPRCPMHSGFEYDQPLAAPTLNESWDADDTGGR